VGVAVAGVLAAGTAAFAGTPKHVTISVDGNVSRVTTEASTVAAVLHHAGVAVGSRDSVTPAVTARVHDGTAITIKRGRQVTFTVDGASRQLWVTADNVGQVLEQAGLRVPDAALSISRSTRVPLSGLDINIDMPHNVTVQVDGVLHSIVSTKPTVGGVLADGNIVVNPTDQVSVGLQTRPFNGMTVVVVRLSSGEQLESVPIPFTSTTRSDPTLLVGTKKVVQTGHDGTLVRTYHLSFADGVQTAKTLVAQQVTVPPTQQIVSLGTKPKPKPVVVKLTNFTLAADSLNWAALARCESGGRASASDAPFYGLYQFRLATWQAVGGSGLPSQASANEQTYRAQLLFKRSNWKTQWPVCGHYLFP
jgi:resuscitation-promoting factor RpfB